MAIARAVLEYCADKRRLGAKTLLATHYHELTALEGQVDGVRNYSITARKQGGGVIFLRRIVARRGRRELRYRGRRPGRSAASVLEHSREYLRELVEGAARAVPEREAPAEDGLQLTLGSAAEDEVLDRLRRAKIETMSPIEALNLLYELQRKLAP